MLVVVWLLQRRVARGTQRQRGGDAVRVVGKRGIGPKAQVVVVEIDDRRYVLGVTEAGVSVIDRLDDAPAEPAALAPLTALPAPRTDELPLRRTHRPGRADARSGSVPIGTFLRRDAAQVLRRALGA